uniref:Uncharacterized protein n=1 Tax=Skeletonema virus LDF-2015a TaxID=1769778 RepID=A0A1B1IHW7_9VIRU|nr:hypothetical protein AUR56_00016 [Skeletonema virus LDF-2015a]
MTTMTVNLLDDRSVETALRVLTGLGAGPVVTRDTEPTDLRQIADTAPDAAPMEQPEPSGDEPDPKKEDIHGLTWREDIHSNPPSMNSDGSWRAKRGKKDEYEAAIKERAQQHAAEAGQTMTEQPAAPAPTTPAMPGMPQPAAPAPTTPAAPIDYDTMARRFMDMLQSGAIQDYTAVYQALGIDYTQLETNQTMIARLWHYMEALGNGETHDASVRHAMGS